MENTNLIAFLKVIIILFIIRSLFLKKIVEIKDACKLVKTIKKYL